MDAASPSGTRPGVALLLLDLQPVFLKAVQEPERVLRRARLALQLAKLLKMPVLATAQVPEKLGGLDERLLAEAPELPVFAKTAFSAWGADGLLEHLRARGIRHLLLAGIETPICVYQTALEARDHDLSLTLLSDALGARRSDDATAALAALQMASQIPILPTETVFYSLLGSAAHPAFRPFTACVKAAQDA